MQKILNLIELYVGDFFAVMASCKKDYNPQPEPDATNKQNTTAREARKSY